MEDCFDREEKVDVDLKSLNYIAFQGGGGKGIAYVGPIDVLTEQGVLPLKLPIEPHNQIPGHNQGIIGISGTSAGAITAYLVALGLTSDNIRNESGFLAPKVNPLTFDPTNPESREYMPGENTSGFNFEHILTKDTPESGYKRAVVYDKGTGRNKIVRATDILRAKIGKTKTNNWEIADDQARQARLYGLDFANVRNVQGNQTRKEKKKGRKAVVYPSQVLGSKEKLKPYVEKLMESRLGVIQKLGVVATIIGQNKSKYDDSKSPIMRSIFKTNQTRNEFVYNAAFDNGLFPGFAINDYFCDVTSRRLPVTLGWDEAKAKSFDKEAASQMTFKEFFEYTGLDLVIAGLNLTSTKQRNFSKDCTPDFPVVAAVQMSMNIPFLFKPVYLDAEIDKNSKHREKLRREFQGYWIDAGVVNNLPFHAFDEKVAKVGFLSENKVNKLMIALAVREGPDPVLFEKHYLRENPDPFFQTFKEKDGPSPYGGSYLYAEYTNSVMTHETDPDYPKENFLHLRGELEGRFPKTVKKRAHKFNGVEPISGPLGTTLLKEFGWLLNLVLLNSTEKQIIEEGAKARVIDVYAYHIGITDFKAEDHLTEFVIRRAAERTRRVLGLEEK